MILRNSRFMTSKIQFQWVGFLNKISVDNGSLLKMMQHLHFIVVHLGSRPVKCHIQVAVSLAQSRRTHKCCGLNWGLEY